MATHRTERKAVVLIVAVLVLGIASLGESGEKVFFYGLEGSPETLDPAKASSGRTDRVVWLLCDTLVNASKDGKSLEPGLAESWTQSPDGLQVVAKLRPGARFHDGTPVDAEAIKASFERQFRPAHRLYTKEPRNTKEARLSTLIEEIQVQGPLTLLLRLKYPGFHYFSNVEIVSPTAAGKLGKDFGKNPVCSGPFRFETWSPQEIVLSAYDGYWAGRPKIDRVVYRIIPDMKEMVESLIRGELDFVPVISDPFHLEQVREGRNLTLISVPGLNIFYLGFTTEKPPFNNSTLRKAVVQAIDVPRISQFLGRGAAVPAKGPLPPAMKGYDPEIAQALHDHEAARALLRTLGPPTPTIRLIYNNALAFLSEIAGAIKSDLAHVGITANLVGKPSFREQIAAVQAREADMFIYSWHVGAPYPERLLPPLFHSREAGTNNLTRYSSPAVDKLLDDALRLPEGTEQQRLYSQAQRRIVEDAPMVFLFHWTRVAAHAKRVQGLQLRIDVAPYDRLVTVDLAR